MSNLDIKIIQLFKSMSIPIDENSLKEFSYREKEKYLERLLERMNYLYRRLQDQCQPNEAKFYLEKDEFRALEWILWEMDLIKSDAHFKTEIGIYKHNNQTQIFSKIKCI